MSLGKKIHTKIIKSYFKNNKVVICTIKSFILFYCNNDKGWGRKTLNA